MTENSNVTTQTTPGANGSTLIEFPGVNRNRPAWRKELSERFREIQQRRALEAEAEQRRQSELSAQAAPEVSEARPAPGQSEATKQLGLVPAPDEPEMNPLVVKALRRIERARREAAPAQPHGRAGSSRGHAAAAAARVVEEQPEEEAESLPALVKPAAEKPVRPERGARGEAAEAARASGLLVVQPRTTGELKPPPAAEAGARQKAGPPAGAAPPVEAAAADAPAGVGVKPQPRKISGVIDDHWLERREAEILPKVAAEPLAYDDRAPRLKRIAAAVVDLFVVAFLCAPCAAVIELTIGDWSEPRVLASFAGIVAVVMFLYHTCSVALASRTFGMKLFRLHAVDADTARVPTTWQCARRALVYLFSLATFGLGILYSLVDAEGRTAHDLLSGTVVVKE
ncbi:MAG TPA: RDD family protein [Pyrinomonadaceae bacterium]|nr:RDD family protein [Pyrinomonadaceae bacterium]